MYPQATCPITNLKGKNEYTHSRAKIHFFAKTYFFQNFEVYLREYT